MISGVVLVLVAVKPGLFLVSRPHAIWA